MPKENIQDKPHRPATPYPAVNAVLAELLAGARSVLGDQFIGLYLYGSLSAGDFDLRRSDVDFLIVTRADLDAETLRELEAMHARITASGLEFARRMEGLYIPLACLPRYEPERAAHPTLCCGGAFYPAAQADSDWVIQRHILREQGVVVAGPPIRPLIEPVLPDDLRSAVRGFVRGWWAPMLANPHRLRDREYQAYAVLTFCRVLYTLRSGEIASKPVSARWAMGALPPRWRGTIERALAWPDGEQGDEFEVVMEMLRVVVEESN